MKYVSYFAALLKARYKLVSSNAPQAESVIS